MKTILKKDTFINITYFHTQLNLKPSELIIYCLIESFEDGFYGSIELIQEWTNLSRNAIQKIILKLKEDKYIYEEEYNGKTRRMLKINFDYNTIKRKLKPKTFKK